MHPEGEGTEKSKSKAFKLHIKAADQDPILASCYAGYIYLYVAEEDESRAFKYLKTAADHDASGAQFELGNVYGKNLGVEKYIKEAESSYRSKLGNGIDKNPSKTSKHFKLAVQYGAKKTRKSIKNSANKKLLQFPLQTTLISLLLQMKS
ncbi:hypothetical protein K501DRAFT_269856 [Backusella circina FSU 941]|nr:hypothetical protein K501DRAFT_269856 [Backusella circina FSU 941]